jgi:hypothetical protein
MSGGDGNDGALSLGGLNAVLNKHLQECALTNQAVATELRGLNAGHGEIKATIKAFEGNMWKALGAVGMLVLAAAITLLFQNLQFKQDTPSQAQLAARTANRYTAQDAASDRARQEEVNKAILSELQAIRRKR